MPQPHELKRRQWLALGASGLAAFCGLAHAQSGNAWERITTAARGQRVLFHTTGRNEPLNAHVQWVIGAMKEQFAVQVQHVRLEADASLARIQSEVAEERLYGSVDLLALSGAQLARALQQGLLFGPVTDNMPQLSLLDTERKPALLRDGATVFGGMVVPWGLSQLTFWLDGRRFDRAPADPLELLTLARGAAGAISYPRPPDAMGSLFLQQLMWSLSPQRNAMDQAPKGTAEREDAWQRVWAYLDALHPLMWRQGREWPLTNDAMRQMMFAGELAFGLSIQPSEAIQEISFKRLPARTHVFQFNEGTLAQTHCVAIPVNARSKAGALCLAHLLLSPEAQARKAAVSGWGDQTVLKMAALSDAQRSAFAPAPRDGALASLAPAVPLPHPGWVAAGLEQAWSRRYARS